jgi:hypothetical protein
MGSRITFISMSTTIIAAGNLVSPPAWIEALATMGMTRTATPGYQISM